VPWVTYPGVQRFSGVRVLGGDEVEKTSGRDLSNFISMTYLLIFTLPV
jgi:hypothetical protein